MVWLSFFAFILTSVHALVVENMDQDELYTNHLDGKKICYFFGSFDPLHLGHESIVNRVLKQPMCETVIVYPAWGGDGYKTRAPVALRLGMLFEVFQDHPHVLVSRLNSQDLQTRLTHTNPDNPDYVIPSCQDCEFIGIVGSDSALTWLRIAEKEKRYLTGLKVDSNFAEHTFGGASVVPVQRFILTKRLTDDITVLGGKIGEREIIHVIEADNYQQVSSSYVKDQSSDSPKRLSMLNSKVSKIIQMYNLYEFF